jgi:hypothetical protein
MQLHKKTVLDINTPRVLGKGKGKEKTFNRMARLLIAKL